MPVIKLETGQKIKIPDGLSQDDIDSIVADVASKTNAPFENPDKVGFIDRFKLGFGNEAGQNEHLKNKGIKATAGQIDRPMTKDDWMNLVPFVGPLKMLGEKATGKDPTPDLAGDIADLPSALPELVGGVGGGIAGSLGGPFLGGVGATAGSKAGEKVRSKIGEGFGTYKNESGNFITPEMEPTAWDALNFIPFAAKWLQKGKSAAREVGKRAFASGSELARSKIGADLSEEELKDVAERALKEGAPIRQKALTEFADRRAAETGKVLGEETRKIGPVMKDQIDNTISKQKDYRALTNEGRDQLQAEFNKKYADLQRGGKVIKYGDEVVTQSAELPPDEVLYQVYRKQFPKDEVKMPMAPFRSTREVPSGRPTFDEWKAEISSSLSQTDDAAKGIQANLAHNAKNPDMDQDLILRKFYEDSFPETKTVSRVFSAPKGKMETPSFEQWKADNLDILKKRGLLDKTTKSEVPFSVEFDPEYLANQKRAYANEARALAGDRSSVSTPAKNAAEDMRDVLKKTLSGLHFEKTGNAGLYDDINQAYRDYSIFGESLHKQGRSTLGSPRITGMTREALEALGWSAAPKRAIGKSMYKLGSLGGQGVMSEADMRNFLISLQPIVAGLNE